jgi:hypothetical protein
MLKECSRAWSSAARTTRCTPGLPNGAESDPNVDPNVRPTDSRNSPRSSPAIQPVVCRCTKHLPQIVPRLPQSHLRVSSLLRHLAEGADFGPSPGSTQAFRSADQRC